MKLWLLRHAEVLLPPGLCYGASDVAADAAHTREAARAAATQLPAKLPVRVSGLGRAQQLARELHALRPDLGPATVDQRLNEMDFGCWELQRWDAIPRAAMDAWTANFDAHRFGGKESVAMLLSRVADALADVRRALDADGEALWITHAGVIRSIQHIATRGPVPVGEAARWPRTEAPTGGLQAVAFAAGSPG
ncbi:histidine phosphatase family protein [Ramlibacter sp.]|uniref:histidine phosphatase family protein n=1 Tax=Ramlibacter sp. TaxID=1917967 RepID=UPI0017ECCA0A|nr:histidine phosphatase family protein [Ramlibacter sp.]MBA2672547.1 histidine phosphatase family protein [Ramlibacter sp.]